MLDFVKAIAAKVVLTEPYRWFARKVLAHFTFRVLGYPEFSLDKYWVLLEKIKEQNSKSELGIFVYLAVDRMALSYLAQKMFTDCEWGHTGILELSDTQPITTISMTSTGYTKRSLLEYLIKTTDNFAVGFLPLKNKDAVDEAWRRIKKLEDAAKNGVEYDFGIQLDKETVEWIAKTDNSPCPQPIKLYCSEMVWLVTNGLIRDDIELKPKWFADRTIIEPDDIAHVLSDNIIFKG